MVEVNQCLKTNIQQFIFIIIEKIVGIGDTLYCGQKSEAVTHLRSKGRQLES